MQHRMLREAQKAMTPWMNGQPIYAPITSNASSQGVPILYSGEWHKSRIRLHLWCFVASNRWLYVWAGFRSRAQSEIKHVNTNLNPSALWWSCFMLTYFTAVGSGSSGLKMFGCSGSSTSLGLNPFLKTISASPKGCCEYTVKKSIISIECLLTSLTYKL